MSIVSDGSHDLGPVAPEGTITCLHEADQPLNLPISSNFPRTCRTSHHQFSILFQQIQHTVGLVDQPSVRQFTAFSNFSWNHSWRIYHAGRNLHQDSLVVISSLIDLNSSSKDA